MLNKNDHKTIAHQAILKAVDIVGSQSAFAKKLSIISGRKVTQGHVSNWIHRDKRISGELAIPAEHLLNGEVTRYELRPDLYPPEETLPPTH